MIKKLLIPSVIAISLAGAGVAFANPSVGTSGGPANQAQAMQKPAIKSEKRAAVKAIMQKYRPQLQSLRQQGKVLKIQINGKMVTKGTTWDEIATMTKQLSSIHNQAMLIKTKARFEIFQKTGVLLPAKGKHKHHHKMMQRR